MSDIGYNTFKILVNLIVVTVMLLTSKVTSSLEFSPAL
jgi:hypothetical protein